MSLLALTAARERIDLCASYFVPDALRHDTLVTARMVTSEDQPTMLHMKALMVDDGFVSVGSTNFDDRSFLLNNATNLNVISPVLAKTMRDVFEADWAQGMRIELQAWRRRPWS